MNPESFFPITFGVHYNTEHLCDTEKKQKCLVLVKDFSNFTSRMKKRIKKMKHILAILLLLISSTALAIPAQRIKKTITLSDGTQKQVVLVGDENLHYYIDNDNNAYICNDQGVFIKKDLNSLENLWKERRANRNKHRIERAEKRGLPIHPKDMTDPSFRHKAKWGAEQNPISGDKKGVVILVNFSDNNINDSHGQEYYDDFFNKVGFSKDGNHGSVHDYFLECSYGQFNVTFDVYGPVTVSNSMRYYGKNISGYDQYPGILVAEACDLADKLGADFSKYDWDDDGEVDQVVVVYAGYGENAEGAPAYTIWPHEGTLSLEQEYNDGNGPISLDGVTINTYAVTCELDGNSGNIPAGIGTACHEFSHCMCLPDFYDTNYENYGMNDWDVMDNGSSSGNYRGNCPVPYTSYERMYCGWLTPQVLDDPGIVTDMKSLYEAPEAYIIYNDANHNEYYLLENHQGEGFDVSSPATGLLVLHVYFDSDIWTKNTVNNETQRMTIIPADGILSEFNNDADTWPGKTGKTELTDTSTPAATLYTGKKLMGKPIESIKEKEGKISFVFNGGINIDAPIAKEAIEVKSDGFTADWNAVTGATGYEVMLTAEDLDEQEYSLEDVALIKEDFSKFKNGKTSEGTTDLSSNLDNYTSMPGWEGKILYDTPQDEVKMSTGRNSGNIYTPWLTTDSKSVTLIFTARQYKSDTNPLKVKLKEGNGSKTLDEVRLTSEPKQYIFTTTTEGNTFQWGLECEKRCYISEMSAYDGILTEEQIASGVVMKKNTTTSTVETEQTSYEFTNLSNQRKYAYSVCALNGKAKSKWSNVIEVQLISDSDGIGQVGIEHLPSDTEHYYSLDGIKLSSPQRGINIIRKVDGSVKKIIR